MRAGSTASGRDFIAELDAAIGCQQCGGPLGASPSDDFCSPRCQAAWSAARAEPLTSYSEPCDVPAHVNNQVELYSPEIDPSGVDDWWSDAVIAAHRREARARFEARTRAAASRQETDAAVAAVFAFGAYRRRHAVGVTPDGDVVGRRPDGRIQLVDHVARRSFDSVLANQVAELGRTAGLPPEMVVAWIHPSIAEQVFQAERERREHHARLAERHAQSWTETFTILDEAARFNVGTTGLTFECTNAVPDVLRHYLGEVVTADPAPDPRQWALELRRNRNTGPATSARAPRAINPRRGR